MTAPLPDLKINSKPFLSGDTLTGGEIDRAREYRRGIGITGDTFLLTALRPKTDIMPARLYRVQGDDDPSITCAVDAADAEYLADDPLARMYFTAAGVVSGIISLSRLPDDRGFSPPEDNSIVVVCACHPNATSRWVFRSPGEGYDLLIPGGGSDCLSARLFPLVGPGASSHEKIGIRRLLRSDIPMHQIITRWLRGPGEGTERPAGA